MNYKGYKIIEHTVLVLGIIVIGILFYQFRFDKSALIVLMAIAAIFYSFWGMVHHLIEERLTVDVALEYILIGLFVFILVLTAISV